MLAEIAKPSTRKRSDGPASEITPALAAGLAAFEPRGEVSLAFGEADGFLLSVPSPLFLL
ncbi:MAG: hypothetical protein ABSB25_08660 [Sedimentisphaerales bacterium]|jgi:hypothetical protein